MTKLLTSSLRMMDFIHGKLRAGAAVLVLLMLATLCGAQTWVATQVPLTIESQGAINAVAINPQSGSVAVGSDSGGLYLSSNPRVAFRRVGGTLPKDIRDVAWLRSSPFFRRAPNVLLATTRHDYRLPNGGGLWRSTDFGENWNQVDLRSLLRLPVANDLDGYAISQDTDTDKVAVATSRGLALTTDRGASWTIVNPFGPSGNPYCAAVAYAFSAILVAGVDGLRWSTDNGRTWTAPRTPMNGSNEGNYHGLTWGTKAGMAYYVDWNANLSYTTDYGQTWRALAVPTVGSGGGIKFVYEVTRGSTLELYFSDSYKLSRLTARADRRPEEIDLTGPWTVYGTLAHSPHSDPRCMAFNRSREAYLLGTDGGLHTTDNRGSTWQARRIRGLEALQIYDVNGQWVGTGRTRTYDVYIGTQDNALRATAPGWLWRHQYGGEGYFLQMRPDVPTGTPVITFTDLNRAFTRTGRYFSAPVQTEGAVRFIENPDPDFRVWAAQPRMISSGRLIQPIRVGSRVRSRLRSGLAISDESGRTWSQLTEFPEPWAPGLPFVSQTRSQIRVFEPYGAGWDETIHRNRILLLNAITSTSSFPTAEPIYSHMHGFGSIGTTSFDFVWIPVLDVHPTDLNSVLAADIENGVISHSPDGGNNWTPLTSLTTLLLHGGDYRFSNSDDVSFVTAISYCPMDPSRILIGCRSGGAYVSTDGGSNWRHVRGSEAMANVTSFNWKSNSEVYASTYGTGLWQFSVAVEVPISAHAQQEQTVNIKADGLSKPPYKGNEVLMFIGGKGDPRQPRYDDREPVQVRLVGLAPTSAKDLEVFLDGKRLAEREYELETNVKQLKIVGPLTRGGHVLRVVWKRGQTQTETGGTFFVGTPDRSRN